MGPTSKGREGKGKREERWRRGGREEEKGEASWLLGGRPWEGGRGRVKNEREDPPPKKMSGVR